MLEFKYIEGWFNFEKLYEEMVKKAPDNANFVELGVWKGLSTSHMCKVIYENNKKINFHAIDWFDGSQEHEEMSGLFPEGISRNNLGDWLYKHCLSNLKPALELDLVKLIRLDARNAVNLYKDNSIDFCYHDASHEYDDLMIELPLWWEKIKPGGYFGGHDYGNWSFVGVGRAVNKFAEQQNLHVTYRAREDSWLLQKPL